MLYIITSVYLICALYLFSKNKITKKIIKMTKKRQNQTIMTPSFLIVLIFFITLFLEYLVKNPTDNHLYSILLFFFIFIRIFPIYFTLKYMTILLSNLNLSVY